MKKQISVADERRSLLSNLQSNYIDWMHACGGKGRCTTCKATVVSGEEGLSPLSGPEIAYRNKGLLRNTERLACQVFVCGDIVIDVPPESQLPHITYDDQLL